MSLQQNMKLTIPAAFFGYALFANYALLAGDVETPELQGFMKGEFASEVDDIYRANLPHRDVAVSWVGAARYALLGEGRSGVVVGRNNWLFSAEEFRITDDFSVPMAWIAEVDAQLAEMGTELVIVPLPAKLEIDAAQFGAEEPPAQIAQTYDDFLAALGAHGITYVDTRPALLAVDRPFFATDTHWTTTGAAAVSGAVADVIGAGDTGFDRVDSDVERFTGDLVTFVTSGGLAPLVGLQREEITPYNAKVVSGATSAGFDLFGTETAAAIALVGTSYSANPRWSFEAALKLALQQDAINYAEEGLGPIAPMQAFLERVDPAVPPPVVIWEFPVRYLSDSDLMQAILQEDANA